MPLTHLSIANAKSRAKEYKLTDSDAHYLAVRPSGAKLWRMNYRHLGRQKTLQVKFPFAAFTVVLAQPIERAATGFPRRWRIPAEA